MRSKAALIAIVVVAGAGALACVGCFSRDRQGNVETKSSTTPSALTGLPQRNSTADEKLTELLRSMTDAAGGDVGLTLTHVESGRTVNIHGDMQLPLYSVFKLPLAVAVLKDVEEKKLQLDSKIFTTPTEIVPGSKENTDLWPCRRAEGTSQLQFS